VEHHQTDIDLTLRHFAEFAAHFILKVVHSPKHALTLLQEDNFDLVLVDLRMPDMTALDLLREAKHLGLLAPFIIITGKGDEAAAVAALKLGAYDYIVKRDNYLTHLPYAIENAIARSQLVQTNRRLQTELAEQGARRQKIAVCWLKSLGQRQRLDEIMPACQGLVWEAWGRPDDADPKTNFVSNHVERMLGYSVQQWLSTPNFWLSIVHPDDKERAARSGRVFRQWQGWNQSVPLDCAGRTGCVGRGSLNSYL
jgi:DNA-binding NarL/FixJ family response regulator